MSANFRQHISLNSELQIIKQLKWKHSFTQSTISKLMYYPSQRNNIQIIASTALAGSANRLNDINLVAGDRAYSVVTMLAELLSTKY